MIPEKLQNEAKAIIEKIRSSKRILLSAHVRPDGDAIGSVTGLMKSLEKMGKEVEVALFDGIPSRFSFVWPSEHSIIQGQSLVKSHHDLILILDCGDMERNGITFEYDKSKTAFYNIDHHASNTNFGDINYVDTGASATCEIVTALITEFGLPLDADLAEALILGLITDSRTFSNEGIRYTTHEAAARLLKTGVSTTRILTVLNSGRSIADLKVQALGLSKMKIECDGHLATVVFTEEELKSLGANVGNVFGSGIFNIPLTAQSIFASVVVFPREDGSSACEFRSRGGIDVKQVAVALGGGGHLPASGCNQPIPVKEMSEKAISLMIKQVNAFFENK